MIPCKYKSESLFLGLFKLPQKRGQKNQAYIQGEKENIEKNIYIQW